jgi:copper(I)-binding protein
MIRIADLYRLLPALFALTLMAAAGHAHEYMAGDMMIGHPWTKAPPAGAKTAAGYAKLMNHGSEPDRLIGGSVEGADKFEIHEMTMDNNVMKMREVKGGLEIKPGQTVELKPGSYHFMIIGLKEPFKAGKMIKGKLVFEKAGTVDVEFKVEAMAAQQEEHKHPAEEHKGH